MHPLLPILHARPRLAAPITLACRAFNPSPALQNFIVLARQTGGQTTAAGAGLSSRHQPTATAAQASAAATFSYPPRQAAARPGVAEVRCCLRAFQANGLARVDSQLLQLPVAAPLATAIAT